MRALLAAFFILIATSALAQSPRVRMGNLPTKVGVGEAQTLEIAVLVPGWFTSPVELPASIDLPNATVRLMDGSAANINERIDGVAWAGIRRRYEIVAASEGDYAIPAIALHFRWSNGAQEHLQTLKTPALTFTARLPEGLSGLGYVIATPQFTLTQTLDRPLQNLRVGDAFIRTLTQRAQGLPAMQLPALKAHDLPGIKTYAAPVFLDDIKGERGAASNATRRDQWTYVLTEPGEITLPGVTLRWYDRRTRHAREASVPPLRVHVAPAPNAAKADAPTPPIAVSPALTLRERLLTFAATPTPHLAIIALLIAALFFAHRHRQRWLTHLLMRTPRPSAQSRALLRAAATLITQRDAATQLRAIDLWRLAKGDATNAPAALTPLWQRVHGRCESSTGLSPLGALRLLRALAHERRQP
jgi:hypothetical protein